LDVTAEITSKVRIQDAIYPRCKLVSSVVICELLTDNISDKDPNKDLPSNVQSVNINRDSVESDPGSKIFIWIFVDVHVEDNTKDGF